MQVEQLPDGASCVVWLRKDIEQERDLDFEGNAYEYWRCSEVSFTVAGTPSAAEIEADFDALWSAHESDGLTAEERIAAMAERIDEQDAALMELGDLLGGE